MTRVRHVPGESAFSLAPTTLPHRQWLRLREGGSAPAFITDHRTWTYDEFADRVDHYRARLGSTRRLVLIQLTAHVDLIAIYLAALTDGHAVIVAPAHQPETVTALIERYHPDVTARAECGFAQLVEHHPASNHTLHPELSLLLTTSGSTGSPKLVRLGAEGVQANAAAIAHSLGLTSADTGITSLPLHYCYGLSVLHSHLAARASLVLTELSLVTPCFWTLARRHQVTTLAGVPYSFDLVDQLGTPRTLLPTLRVLTQAGGRLPASRVRHFARQAAAEGWELFVMYGQTEATARLTILPAGEALTHAHTVGRSIPGVVVRVESDRPHEPGEVLAEGTSIMWGYATSPADLGRGREVTTLRTGDIGRWTSDGHLELLGRAARFAKVLGTRVDLDHTQDQLADLGLDAWVVTDTQHTQLRAVTTGDPRAVRAELQRLTGLPRHLVSATAVPSLPRTSAGKPDYSAAQRLSQPAATTEATTVRSLYADLLGREVSLTDSFTSLGGDSLSYVEASLRLEKLLGHLPHAWHQQPVGELEKLATTPPGRRGLWRTVETSVVLRALAIVLIVGTHSNVFTLMGGAHVLIALVGFNYARFLLDDGTESVRALWRRTSSAVARIAVPSAAWIAGTILVLGAYPWPSALLINSWVGSRAWGDAWHLWFVEAALYLVLAATCALSLPGALRAVTRWPLLGPLALGAVALLARYDLLGLNPDPGLRFLWYGVGWLFCLGWAAAVATHTGHRLALSAVTALTVPGFFDDSTRGAVVVLGVLALIWLPRVYWPQPLVGLTGWLASSSLAIYLVHWQIYPAFENDQPLVGWLLSIVIGVAAWHATTWTWRAATTRLVRNPS